ncbi:MAG: indolepyruvate ferredoxin oxidoreductase subunit alpha [Bacillota bacterium]
MINGQLCRGCGVCRDACPPGSVHLNGQLAVIDEQQCIRCFCCQELCPHGAIGIRKSWLNRRIK